MRDPTGSTGVREKRLLLFSLGLTLGFLLFTCVQAQAQSIAVIKSYDIEPLNQALAGFVSACDNHLTEYNLRGSEREGRDVIKHIIAAKPKFIVAIGPLAAQIAKEGGEDIPVVFFMVPNPHKHGLEGENIAGISLDVPIETQFAMYKSIVPTLKTFGVIYDPEKTGTMITQAGVVAERLGLQLLAAPAASEKAVPAALRSLLGKIDALWMVPDETVVTPESFQFLSLAAFENNLPFLAVSDIFVEVGALASLSPDYTDVGRQGCQLITEIQSNRLSLKKVKVVPPAKVNLSINLKTASKIGLTPPPGIIQAASKVYR